MSLWATVPDLASTFGADHAMCVPHICIQDRLPSFTHTGAGYVTLSLPERVERLLGMISLGVAAIICSLRLLQASHMGSLPCYP